MDNDKWDESVTTSERREQLKLIYDYIKFHIGLYLATPAALGLLADTFDVKKCRLFSVCLFISIFVFLVAGSHAAYFMAKYINNPWKNDYLEKFEAEAFTSQRRFLHHGLFWLGLFIGLLGLVLSILKKYFF